MQLISTKGRVFTHALIYLCLFACLTLSSHRLLTDTDATRRHQSVSAAGPNRVTPGPLPFWSVLAPTHNDPVRFTIRCEKPAVRIGESFDLIITAELLNLSPNLLFFLPGSNAFRVKMLLPPGFEQTGGDFVDYVGGELSFPARPVATYRLTGHFVTATAETSFRLLRSYGRATDQSLFVEKAALNLKTSPGKANQFAPASTRVTAATLLVITDAVPSSARARETAPSALTVLAPTYDCATGAITFNTAGGDSTTIRYMAIGITGWTTDPNQYLDAEARISFDLAPFTIIVEQSGKTYFYTWSRQMACADSTAPVPPVPTPPATVTITPPVTVTAAPAPTGPTALSILAPTYDCATGAITFNTAGGDSTAVRYMAIGITGWTTNPNQFLDAQARISADAGPFTILVEQSGKTQSYIWSRQGACADSTAPAPPAPTPPVTTTVTPPVTTTVTPPTTTTVTPAPPASIPFSYQVPSQPAAWMGYRSDRIGDQRIEIKDVSYQENGQLKIEVRKGFGCSLQIYDKVTNQALINFTDLGRESGMSSYGGPKSFSNDAPFWRTGYNPLQAGDSGGNPATLLFHGFITVDGKQYIYTKTQQNSWAHHDNRMLQFFYEQWVNLTGNKVHVYVRLTHRNPDKTFYEADFQEWPMMMINGSRVARFYTGDQPFTFGNPTGTDGVERRNPNGSVAVLHQLTPFIISEPWMGVEIGTNRMIGLVTPDFYHVNYNYSDPQSASSNESGKTIMYVANQPFVHLDSDNTWYKQYTYVVGTEKEVRTYAYEQPRNPKIDFAFTKAAGRNGWFIQDGGFDQKEPFANDNWQVTFKGKADPGQPHSARGTKLRSPFGSWKASDNPAIYVRLKYSGPESQLRLTWLLAGQEENGLDPKYPNQNVIRAPKGVRRAEQHTVFNLIKDGQFHTYKLNVGANGAWNNIVQQLDLEHVPGGILGPGEQFEVSYIGANNPSQ